MWRPLYFHGIVLVLMMAMKSFETQIIDVLFDMVEPGQSIVGKLGPERPARKQLECSSMCLLEGSCLGYQYKDNRTELGKCILIHNGCQNVQISGSAVTYKKVSSQQSDGSWIPPTSWTGPSAVLYQSFDSSDGFVLIERNQATSVPVPLVCGKVNCAWNVDRTKNQWVYLGIHTEASMTRPETCGAAGGAMSLWVKEIDCDYDGIISSCSLSASTGSLIGCNHGSFKLYVYLPNGRFFVSESRPTGWFHVVLNYIGPNNGQGIRIYYNGAEEGSDQIRSSESISAGDGRIVVGRWYTNRDSDYSSVQGDELIYFNSALTSDDVQSIYNSA